MNTDTIKGGLSDRIHKATGDGKSEVAAALNEFREFSEPLFGRIEKNTCVMQAVEDRATIDALTARSTAAEAACAEMRVGAIALLEATSCLDSDREQTCEQDGLPKDEWCQACELNEILTKYTIGTGWKSPEEWEKATNESALHRSYCKVVREKVEFEQQLIEARKDSAPATIKELQEIHDEASSEVYAGVLSFGEVGTSDFIKWVKTATPEVCEGRPLVGFDLSSVMSLFEEWVKGPRPTFDQAKSKCPTCKMGGEQCECINWCRDDIKIIAGKPLLTNHHPRCLHYNDSLMDVWRVTIFGDSCYAEIEKDAKDMAGEEGIESGEAVITKEKMHREIFENLPDFNGF